MVAVTGVVAVGVAALLAGLVLLLAAGCERVGGLWGAVALVVTGCSDWCTTTGGAWLTSAVTGTLAVSATRG